MLRFIQEVNTTTRSCTLWDLDEDTEYIVHVQSVSMAGSGPLSEPVLFRTPKESEKMASKSPGEGRLMLPAQQGMYPLRSTSTHHLHKHTRAF